MTKIELSRRLLMQKAAAASAAFTVLGTMANSAAAQVRTKSAPQVAGYQSLTEWWSALRQMPALPTAFSVQGRGRSDQCAGLVPTVFCKIRLNIDLSHAPHASGGKHEAATFSSTGLYLACHCRSSEFRCYRTGMEHLAIKLLGFAAATCTTLAYAPQFVKVWRTRSTEDISLGMFLVMVLGLMLWLLYGLLSGDAPLIASNAITIVLAGGILFMKLKYG